MAPLIELETEQRERLRKERERAGLTQAELARRAGTVSQYVNQLESGKKTGASLDVLQRLGNELGLSITVKTIVSIKRKRRT
jgi:transcriptional regulator with XRE-family HTH domain